MCPVDIVKLSAEVYEIGERQGSLLLTADGYLLVPGTPTMPYRPNSSGSAARQTIGQGQKRKLHLADDTQDMLLTLTADIVAAHVSNNGFGIADLPDLITRVYGALAALGTPIEQPVEEQKPAVPVHSSVKPDYIVCLEDGKKLKMMRRHLMTAYGMTPDDYRAKWSLPKDYPMVAPNYTETRRVLAKAIGLGTKGRGGGHKPAATPTPARRGRPKAGA